MSFPREIYVEQVQRYDREKLSSVWRCFIDTLFCRLSNKPLFSWVLSGTFQNMLVHFISILLFFANILHVRSLVDIVAYPNDHGCRQPWPTNNPLAMCTEIPERECCVFDDQVFFNVQTLIFRNMPEFSTAVWHRGPNASCEGGIRNTGYAEAYGPLCLEHNVGYAQLVGNTNTLRDDYRRGGAFWIDFDKNLYNAQKFKSAYIAHPSNGAH